MIIIAPIFTKLTLTQNKCSYICTELYQIGKKMYKMGTQFHLGLKVWIPLHCNLMFFRPCVIV